MTDVTTSSSPDVEKSPIPPGGGTAYLCSSPIYRSDALCTGASDCVIVCRLSFNEVLVAHEQVKRGNFLYQGLNEFILDPLYHGVRRPIRYLSDTGLLCALLNLRSEEALRQSPAVGAVWETFVFAQLRDCERRGGRTGSLFFWRDRTREVDFVVDTGGRLELFEVKWTELPDVGDTVNLDFVRNVVGKSRVAGGAVVCRTPNGFPLPNGFRALPVTELR